jgi:hypothetical protein
VELTQLWLSGVVCREVYFHQLSRSKGLPLIRLEYCLG